MSGKPTKPEVVDSRIEKIVISTDALKAILKGEFGRDVESVSVDEREELWTIDFLTPEEKAKE